VQTLIDRLPSRTAAALAALAFAAGATFAYVAQRLYEASQSTHSDPSQILLSAHAAFPWRAAIATWVGGLCALITLILLRGDLPTSRRQRLARRLATATALAALLLTVVALRFP